MISFIHLEEAHQKGKKKKILGERVELSKLTKDCDWNPDAAFDRAAPLHPYKKLEITKGGRLGDKHNIKHDIKGPLGVWQRAVTGKAGGMDLAMPLLRGTDMAVGLGCGCGGRHRHGRGLSWCRFGPGVDFDVPFILDVDVGLA